MSELDKEFLKTRRSLISRLQKVGDDDSWQEFFNCYGRLIFTTATKAGLNDQEAEDVVQETIMSITRNIAEFEYNPERGSFKNWLLRATKWKITDQLRKRQPVVRKRGHAAEDQPQTGTIERVPDPNGLDPAQIWDAEWENNIVELALEKVKARVDPKVYQLFDLSSLKSWPMSRIAATLKVSRAKVYLARHRVKVLLGQEIKALHKKFEMAELAAVSRTPRQAS